MSTEASEQEDVVVTFRVASDRVRRKIRMRAAQSGHNNVSEYIRTLLDDDLEDAELPLE